MMTGIKTAIVTPYKKSRELIGA